MEFLESIPFDQLELGQQASMRRQLTLQDLELHAVATGGAIPERPAPDGKAGARYRADESWLAGMLSALVTTQLPGPSSRVLSQALEFPRSVDVGEDVTLTVTVASKDPGTGEVSLRCEGGNQHGEVVLRGDLRVRAPTERMRRPRAAVPEVRLSQHTDLQRLMEAASRNRALTTAVVHPVDQASLGGAIAAAEAGLIIPVLVGPEARIRSTAASQGLDLDGYRIVGTEHSHAAAEAAVELARSGQVGAIMKGSLHTDELMAAALDKARGVRTDRWVSHVFAFDVPAYPRPLFITDAAINIYPDLDAKRDIVQNAIELAHALGIERPKVAILSAVETVTHKIQSTLDAAALCKMADRGQITGAILDGPLAFDNAISAAAAQSKGIVSAVAGEADILVVPDLESGNMLAKQLEYLAGAEGAGIVLGTRVPIMLTSRADDTVSRMASCALAVMLSQYRHQLLKQQRPATG